MTCYIIDTETTGLDKPQVIELGWLLKAGLNSHKSQDVFVQRFRPSKDIELGALRYLREKYG